VTWLHLAAVAFVLVGIGIRIVTYNRYMEAHVHRYRKVPPRGWLWTGVDDPAVERLRRIMAGGSVLAIVGLVFLAVDFLGLVPR
jgi:hypothetical protein